MDYLAVDSGTTHSRLWLMRDREVLEKRQIAVGVRNTALDGNNRALMEGIGQAVLELKNLAVPGVRPKFVIAAGMITSNLGLHEVKHAQAPVGIQDLSCKIQGRTFPEMEGVPFYFIPGVRSGPAKADLSNVNDIDIVRGEETEVIGALQDFGLQGPLLYIHLGSHTKLIKVDAANRIGGGASTLAGELSHAIQRQTILRDSLPEHLTSSIQECFLDRGWSHCRKHGLFRALYLVRIFDLNSNYSKESIASFFLGALISEEFRCLESFTNEGLPDKMVLSGLPHLHPVWLHFLRQQKPSVLALSAEQTEHAFLSGLYEIFKSNPQIFAKSY